MSEYIYPDEANTTPPTQTQFPLKAVVRTIMAYLVGLAMVSLITAIPDIEDPVRQAEPHIVDALTNSAIVIISGFVTWLMTRPAINKALTKVGLGARPKSVEPEVRG